MAEKTLQATPGNAPMPPPGKPLLRSFPTPELQDRILQVRVDSRKGKFEVPVKGSAFAGPNENEFEDFKFATCIPDPAAPGEWWLQFYINERKNQDDYNYAIEHPWVDETYPRVTRTYVILRKIPGELIPDPDEVDPANDELSLVDYKITRAEDPIIDALFIAITKRYERVPAPTEYSLDRADAVLPYNMRVRVPAFQVTQVDELAAQIPILVNEEDWTARDTTDTFNRRTRVLTKRVIPDGAVTLNKGYELTREQQLGRREQTWAIGDQRIIPRATTIRSTIEDVGNNTTLKDELIVDRVFPATEIKVEIPDIIPPRFRTVSPTRTVGITSAGQVTEPVLQVGEIERIHRAETDLIKREIVVGRDTTQLPKTIVDYDLDGIPTHGSVFGGIYTTLNTLSAAPEGLPIEEGFEVLKSSVQSLGNGLTLRETKKLWGFQGAYLLLTNPGHDFTCDPAVVFSSGEVGTDASATSTITPTPIGGGGGGGGGIVGGEDNGGIFTLDFDTFGDANGAFTFIGARYNNGVWRNPSTAENIDITAAGEFSLSDILLDRLVDHENSPYNTQVIPLQGGGHYFAFDMGPGRKLKANYVTVKSNAGNQRTHRMRVEGFNNFVDPATEIGDDIIIPIASNAWVGAALDNTVGFRYFRVYGTDGPLNTTPPVFPEFGFSEIEFYGELSIAPSAGNLFWIFDGDAKGVFHFLGQRGGNGVWRNPHTNGDMVVAADGLIQGALDEIVDRQPSNVYTNAAPARAFYFDLKAGRSLICNKVSYRQRTTFSSATTSFNLQGRNDLGDPDDWTDLVVVNPDQRPDYWTSVDVPLTIGYRQFRIINGDANNFTIGELELYGTLDLGPPGGGVSNTFSVTGVTMLDGGQDYAIVPEVRFVGDGTGAEGTAVIEDGSVVRVDMLAGGQNYTSAPGVFFFVPGGGKNAAATGVITLGQVTEYTISNAGVEYGVAPLVEVIGDGTGATATAVVNASGQVIDIVPGLPGSGYTTATVLFRNAGGPIATATVGYGVASITKTASGADYIVPPAVEVRGDGTGCQARSILGFPIARVDVTNRGNNYTSTPTAVISTAGQGGGTTSPTLTAVRGFPILSVSFSPDATLFLNEPAVTVVGGGVYGQEAAFKAWVGRPVLELQLGSQGENYSSDIALSFIDPGGTGTGATGSASRSFALDSITGGTGGTGYTEATVTIGAPTGINGIQAVAHAVITTGVITSIVIDDYGFGYLTAPPVSVTGDGTGASAATAVLETLGAIDSVSLGATGAGYSEPPIVIITATTGATGAISSVLNTLAVGTLVKVTIVNVGFGYTTAPTLAIAGAPAPSATLSTIGQIVAVTVASAPNGAGFIQNAAVTFVLGGGSGATATAILHTVGVVKSFAIDDPGEGFTTEPEVFVSAGAAAGDAVLEPTGKIKLLTLIDPGPEYSIAPLVSFLGCDGLDAAALYILPTGYPVLFDYITDPREGIVVEVEKKIVRPDAVRPAGFVDQYALDKYRSIQLISRVDLSTLPLAEEFYMTHVLKLPDTLVSLSATYTKTKNQSVSVHTAFGSTSVHASVKGKLFARIQAGYNGPAKAKVIRTFLPAPPTEAQTPNPLIITPSTGTVYLISRGNVRNTSLGVRGGFGYIEEDDNQTEDIDALQLSGLLTGSLIVNQSSSQSVDPTILTNSAIARARQGGFFFDGTRTRIAKNVVTAQASLIADIAPSCPVSIPPGTTFLLSSVVEKWKLDIYVQTLTYVTVPCPGGSGLDMYDPTVCAPCGGAITGGGGS